MNSKHYHDSARDELRELIERVEKATGADREVDAEIMFDLFAKPVGEKDDGGPVGYLWPEDNPSWNFGIRFPGKDREWFAKSRSRIDGETLLIERDGALVLMNSLRIPPLTASLDAAIALVERMRPGWAWTVHSSPMSASIWTPQGTASDATYQVPGATPALALLLTLLRSLEQETDNG